MTAEESAALRIRTLRLAGWSCELRTETRTRCGAAASRVLLSGDRAVAVCIRCHERKTSS